MIPTARKIGLTILGLAMAVILIIGGLAAQAIRDGDSERAMLLRPSSAAARSLRAAALLSGGKPEAARAMAQRALMLQPVDVRALRVAALANDRLHHPETASALMTLSGKLSWRDTKTQFFLFKHALEASDAEGLFLHGDALLRRRVLMAEIFTVYSAISGSSEARRILGNYIADRPAWRGDYFQSLAVVPPAAQAGVDMLIRDLRHSIAPASRREIAAYLVARVQGGDYEGAYRIWRYAFGSRSDNGLIHDGNFETTERVELRSIPGIPFEWSAPADSLVDVSFTEPNLASGDRALVASYSEASGADIADQLLLLPRGRFRLTWRSREEPSDDQSPRLSLRIACAGNSDSLAETGIQKARHGEFWTLSSIDIKVPDSSCPAQLLRIVIAPGDIRRSSRFWIDHISIEPLRAEATTSARLQLHTEI